MLAPLLLVELLGAPPAHGGPITGKVVSSDHINPIPGGQITVVPTPKPFILRGRGFLAADGGFSVLAEIYGSGTYTVQAHGSRAFHPKGVDIAVTCSLSAWSPILLLTIPVSSTAANIEG